MCKDADLALDFDGLALKEEPVVLRGGGAGFDDWAGDEVKPVKEATRGLGGGWDDDDSDGEVLRGAKGADAAFDEWAAYDDADVSAALSRCLTDEMAWDESEVQAVMLDAAGEEALLDEALLDEALAGAQLAVHLKPHRVEPLTAGAAPENLVHSIRQFAAEVTVHSAVALPALALRASLVFADTGHDVPPYKGEAPLAGDTVARLESGAASFRLRVPALSYRHGRRPFALCVRPADPARAARLPAFGALSAPFRGVARLPNEAPSQQQQPQPLGGAAGAAGAAAAVLRQPHVAPSADALAIANANAAAAAAARPCVPPYPQLASPSASFSSSTGPPAAPYTASSPYMASPSASTFSATSSPPASPLLGFAPPPIAVSAYATGAPYAAGAPPGAAADQASLELEVRRLRQMLEGEVAGREAYREAFEAQAAQLSALAAQQAQILQQMSALRGGAAGAPTPAAPTPAQGSAQGSQPPQGFAPMPGMGW